MDTQPIVSLAPILQYGFAGFCLLLLAVIVWQFRQLLNLTRGTNRVINACTHAIEGARETSEEVRTELRALRDEQLRSGCPFSAGAKQRQHFLLPDPEAELARGLT